MKYKNKKGQSLIEVLVGITSLVIVIAAITTASITALNNAQYSKNQNLASSFAQQGMEVMRNLRNYDYGTFQTLSGDYCLAKNCSTLNNNGVSTANPCGKKSGLRCAPEQNIDFFVRTVTVSPSSSDCQSETKVEVSVAWYDGKCQDSNNIFCHMVNIRSCLSSYTVIPTP